MIQKGVESFANNQDDSVNIILLRNLHDRVSVLFINFFFVYLLIGVSKYFKASCKIKNQ